MNKNRSIRMGTENMLGSLAITETWRQNTSRSHVNAADTESWLAANTTRSLTNTSLTPVVFTSMHEQVLNIVFVVIFGLYSILSQVSVIMTIVKTPSLQIPHFFIVLGMCVSDTLLLVMTILGMVSQHITGDILPGENANHGPYLIIPSCFVALMNVSKDSTH